MRHHGRTARTVVAAALAGGLLGGAAPAWAAPGAPPAAPGTTAALPADGAADTTADVAAEARARVERLAKSALPAEIRTSAWNALRSSRGAAAEWLAPGEQVRTAARWALRPGSTDADADVAEFFGYGWANAALLDLEAYRLSTADAEVRRHHLLSGLVDRAAAVERTVASAADKAKARADAVLAWQGMAARAHVSAARLKG